ncbi:MAG TPA: signal recognition particle protein, partial [Candidatus Polarisedimenticolaceae bacterium]|nr:signal recognition particle protein [Candidatus Polarisedimenticolaceae bacterium]
EKKIRKNSFTLDDFRDQLRTVRKMGPLSSIVSMLPGMSQVKQADLDEGAVVRVMAILDSMTPRERERPEILNGSRKRRVSRGAGQSVAEINRLLKQFAQMRKMMKTLQAARPGKGGKGGLRLPFLGR